MTYFMKLVIVLLLTLLASQPLFAQPKVEKKYYDKQGHYTGKDVTQKDNAHRLETRSYDKQGHYTGKSVTSKGETRYYDKQGHLERKSKP